MLRISIITVLLLGLSFTASADPNVVSRGYELTLADFRAPATENGGITYRTCSDCDFISSRVGPGTRYTLNGQSIRLADLRKALVVVRDRESVFVTVLRHLESNTIVSVSVTLPE